jgi:two-component system chemotaxis sensor kinase CheA
MPKPVNQIMVVEDELLLLDAITKKLKLLDYAVVPCTGGRQALTHLEEHSSAPPDAIWLDYYLKDMNGMEFLRKVRQRPEWDNLPVIVVSNSASPEKVHAMLGLGAKSYILKAEHRLEDIIAMIETCISEAKAQSKESPA